jgi:hypothetical protein
MLQRGQTTEERIAQIAQGFGQGAQNFIQGQDKQRAQAAQAEEIAARKRALGLEVEGKAEDRAMKRQEFSINNLLKADQLKEISLPFEETRDYKKTVASGKAREETRIAAEERALIKQQDKQKYDAVDSIRKEVSTFKPSKDMQDVDVSLSKIMSAPETAAGDMSLIYGYNKILDPGTGVKEGEFANAEQTKGMDQSVAAAYNKLRNGQRLTPSQREDFRRAATKLGYSQYKNFSAATNPHRNRLKELGVDEKQVLPSFSQQGIYDSSAKEESEINRMNELRAKRIGGV